MDHSDHTALLRDGIVTGGGLWADLGAGTGAFTLALADLIGGGVIYAVDQDRQALMRLERSMKRQFPATTLHLINQDFTRPLSLPPLDGLVIANALHFVKDQQVVLAQFITYLQPGGRFLLVEYESDHGNSWVPYPFRYATWEKMAAQAGLVETRRLAFRPSRFLNGIYAAASLKPPS